MSITIKRRTKYIRAFAPIYLKLNGKIVARIMENEEVDLSLPTSESLLTVRGNKKSRISVSDSDVVIIKDNVLNILTFWSGVLAILFGQFIFSPGTWIMAIITWLGLASILASLFIPRFLLEKAGADQ
ncbi:hypothetical protein [Streptococcus sp. S784/96/1]|uniref:hypothetical protein n=2 Tax=Streptococcus sp. S784/96/1 TaxID=2653499 RepID=UPI0013871E1C|nr:hypothetical protein [Streptococcus sp. S784/96/1]